MNIVIGSDHRGFHHKLAITEAIRTVTWLDAGCFTADRCDYPVFAQAAVRNMKEGQADHGVLICGSGVGMSIAANRFPGVYAALAWNELTARLAKEHDGANVLVLPADFITTDQAQAMVQAWLSASFLGGRYQDRLVMIDKATE